MKKTYLLEELGCAHCAAKMETAIAKLDGVNEVVINFMTRKMTIDAQDDKFEEVIAQAKKKIAKIERDVVVKEL
ncbi:MAG: hypothetical protein E7269_06215 [Lachnospiraceae bacterium]|nr:hypothetical protein [Lachnospiraceae bacterium]